MKEMQQQGVFLAGIKSLEFSYAVLQSLLPVCFYQIDFFTYTEIVTLRQSYSNRMKCFSRGHHSTQK